MDNTFWALVALVIFLIVLAVFKIPARVTQILDQRARRISDDLEEARRLREEAQQLLAEYQRKRLEAEKEAESILTAANREAQALLAEAHTKTAEYVERRNKMAEERIAQAEVEAVNAVRSAAVDLAVLAAEKVLGEEIQQNEADKFFKVSLNEVKTHMH